MWTLGFIFGTTVAEIARRTHYMEGAPLSDEAVTSMIHTLTGRRIDYCRCHSLTEAHNFMAPIALHEFQRKVAVVYFAFAWMPHGGNVGHMIVAQAQANGLTFIDRDNHGQSHAVAPPQHAASYFVWRVI